MSRVWAWLRRHLGIAALIDSQWTCHHDQVDVLRGVARGQTENHLAILGALAALKAEIIRRGDLADEATRRLDLRLGSIERRHQDDAEIARNDLRYLTRMTWGTTPPIRIAGPARQPKEFTQADRQ